jgi:hypothetical protein
MDIQHHISFKLYDAIKWVAQRFGFAPSFDSTFEELPDWKRLERYAQLQDIEFNREKVLLKEYDSSILKNLNYNVRIEPWLKEGMTQEVLNKSLIGYYPGANQITIPHFDENGRFIGLRGRTICAEDAERFGKYRPLRVNQISYSHPLGLNLYNLNNSKDNIKRMGKAIVAEAEKSTLQFRSYFGIENDISVACCGSSVSAYQMQLLLDAGAKEIIICFDRQFQQKGDKEFIHLRDSLLKLNTKYRNSATISFIFDKNMITGYKASPLDEGKEKFLKLYKERIIL